MVATSLEVVGGVNDVFGKRGHVVRNFLARATSSRTSRASSGQKPTFRTEPCIKQGKQTARESSARSTSHDNDELQTLVFLLDAYPQTRLHQHILLDMTS